MILKSKAASCIEFNILNLFCWHDVAVVYSIFFLTRWRRREATSRDLKLGIVYNASGRVVLNIQSRARSASD